MSKNFCEFCEIIEKKPSLLIYQDEQVVVFHDVDKASAKEHILVCPAKHLDDISTLNESHIPLIDYMEKIGNEILKRLSPDGTYRFGFHSEQFVSISHLHLHCFVLPFKDIFKDIAVYGHMLQTVPSVKKRLFKSKL